MVVNNGMDEPKLDPAVMAGLIEGTLSPEERKRALAIIAASPADREWFVEASASYQDVGKPEPPEIVRWRTPARWIPVLAAAMALLAIGYTASRRGLDGSLLGGALDLGRDLATGEDRPLQTRFGSGWAEAVGSSTRGAGRVAGRALAIRAGVGLAHLEVAAAAGDSASAHEASRALVRLLNGVSGGGAAVRKLELLAGGSDESARREAGTAVVAAIGDPAWTTVGSWLEVGRLAVTSRVTAVEETRVRRTVDRLRATDPEAATMVGRLLALPVDGALAADQLRQLLDSLLTAPPA